MKTELGVEAMAGRPGAKPAEFEGQRQELQLIGRSYGTGINTKVPEVTSLGLSSVYTTYSPGDLGKFLSLSVC